MSGSAIDTMSAEDTALMKQIIADDTATATDTAPPDGGTPAPMPADPAVPQPQKTVPLEALHEERGRRKRLEGEIAELRTKSAADVAKLTERFDLLRQAAEAHVAAPPAVPTPAPDFATDPAGYIKHRFDTLHDRLNTGLRGLEDRIGKVETGTTRMSETQQQHVAIAELQRWGAAQEAEFAAQTPDYQAAMTHLRNTRAASLRRVGVPAEQIDQTIANEVTALANQARQQGSSFGELLYGLAQDYGYRKGEAPAGSGGGVIPATPGPTPAERLLRGQDMASSLGSTGAAPRGEPGPQHLAEMSDQAFAEYLAKVQKNPAAMRELFGG